jgi:hypothetical protein
MNTVNYIVVLAATCTSTWTSADPDGSVFTESEVSEVREVYEFETAWQAADAVREIREDPCFSNVRIGFARVGDVCLGL